MGVLTFLLLICLFTSTNGVGVWCYQECDQRMDAHCGDSSYANCEYKGLNYCMVKIQECARVERNWPKFDYIVRGKCFRRRPQCREFRRIKGPKNRPRPIRTPSPIIWR